ncbi:uncharacterized protein LOC144319224 isoform X1 [Canis aureus]
MPGLRVQRERAIRGRSEKMAIWKPRCLIRNLDGQQQIPPSAGKWELQAHSSLERCGLPIHDISTLPTRRHAQFSVSSEVKVAWRVLIASPEKRVPSKGFKSALWEPMLSS